MKVLHKSDAPAEMLGDEARRRYTADHLRIVVTDIPAGHVENEHSHDRLGEAIWVLAGEVEISERDAGGVTTETIREGDLVVFGPGRFHNVANRSASPARMLTVKFATPLDLETTDFADWRGYDGPVD